MTGVQAKYHRCTVGWRIHTGPFPFVAPPFDGEIWLWRITDGEHFTAVTVKFGRRVCEAEAESLVEPARSAVLLRGRSAIAACLGWPEPPREIAFDDPGSGPTYWGGQNGGAEED